MRMSTHPSYHRQRPAVGDSSATSSSLYDVLDLILEKGLVIDAFVRVSLVGIELLTVDARIVIASVDTYLRFAAATNRLDLERRDRRKPGVPELLGYGSDGGGMSGLKLAASVAGGEAAEGAAQTAAQGAQKAVGGPRSMTGRLADWFCHYAESDQQKQKEKSEDS